MYFLPFHSSLPDMVTWLVLSWRTKWSSEENYHWLCRFCREAGIDSLRDFAFVDLCNVQEYATWRELPDGEKLLVGEFLGRDADMRPNFRSRAEATLHDLLCRHIDHFSVCEQDFVTKALLHEINFGQGIFQIRKYNGTLFVMPNTHGVEKRAVSL